MPPLTAPSPSAARTPTARPETTGPRPDTERPPPAGKPDASAPPPRRPARFAIPAVAALLLGAALLAGLLLSGGDDESGGKGTPEFRTATASMYRLTGNKMACGGMMDVYQLGVAHKTLPCGTTIQLRYHGKSQTVQVVDRGPYVGGREFDLTAETARRLDFSGVHTIQWRIVRDVGEERHARSSDGGERKKRHRGKA